MAEAMRDGDRPAIVRIRTTSHGTTVAITDPDGDALCRASSAAAGFKESRGGTPFAIRLAAEKVASEAAKRGITEVDVRIEGTGRGRETALAALRASGLVVNAVEDVPRPIRAKRKIHYPPGVGTLTREQADAVVDRVLRRLGRVRDSEPMATATRREADGLGGDAAG